MKTYGKREAKRQLAQTFLGFCKQKEHERPSEESVCVSCQVLASAIGEVFRGFNTRADEPLYHEDRAGYLPAPGAHTEEGIAKTLRQIASWVEDLEDRDDWR